MAITRTPKTVPTAGDFANLTHITDALNGYNNLAANAVDMTDGKMTSTTTTVGDGSGSGDAGDRSWILQVTDTVKKILKWNQTTGRMRLENEAAALLPLEVADPSVSTQAATKGYTDTLVATTFPTGYRGSAPPVYASSTTFTVAFLRDRNSADDGNIAKATSTTVDITTTGLNGIARSTANLTGTIAYNNASATVTGTSTTFTTDLVVGDTLYDQTNSVAVGVVLTIASNTSLTLAAAFSGTNRTGASYRRGARFANSRWYLYAITDGTTKGLILSNRNVAGGQTLVDLPSGYTKSRQQPVWWALDGSSNLINQFCAAGWPYRPEWRYAGARVAQTVNTAGGAFVDCDATFRLLSAGTAAYASPGTITVSTLCPPIARELIYNWGLTSSSVLSISSGDNTKDQQSQMHGAYAGGQQFGQGRCRVDLTDGTIDYWQYGGSSVYLSGAGYVVTEVA